MTKSFTKQNVGLAAAVAMALAIMSGTAIATDAAKDSAYATDSRGNVAMSGYGLCWHSDFGPRPGYYECNTQPVAQIVAPAPAPYVPPVVVAAAAPQPVYEKVTLDANVLFA